MTISVYFSHPITHYNTDFEWECMGTILNLLTPIGEDIQEDKIQLFNPNQKWLSALYEKRKEEGHESPFSIFEEIAAACDIVVGVTFFDGWLGAGVSTECDTGKKNEKDVYMLYLNEGRKLFFPFTDISHYRVLSVDETRERIRNGVM